MHEHPWSARSWALECIEDLLNDGRVHCVQTHMCRFGMESRIGSDSNVKGPVKKPTGFMTSSWCIRDELDRRCSPELNHTHVPLVEGRAAAAQVYPEPLCRAICAGIARQKAYDHVRDLANLGLIDKRREGLTRRLTTTRRFAEYFGCPEVEYRKVRSWFRGEAAKLGLTSAQLAASLVADEQMTIAEFSGESETDEIEAQAEE